MSTDTDTGTSTNTNMELDSDSDTDTDTDVDTDTDSDTETGTDMDSSQTVESLGSLRFTKQPLLHWMRVEESADAKHFNHSLATCKEERTRDVAMSYFHS